MERIFSGVALAVLLTGVALAQDPPKSPVFEAADVHLRLADPYMSGRSESYASGGLIPGGRFELHRANMADLIQAAYGLQDFEVYGGPAWLEIDHYEIIAKTPPGVSQADVKPMLQALLADRFKLVAHSATEPLDVVAFTPGKQAALKESEGEAQGGCKYNGGGGGVVLECHHMTIADFVKNYGWAASNGTRPPVDLTGLKGAYDFTLQWTPTVIGPPHSGPHITFAEAVDKRLGLKIVEQKYPLPVLVVDSVNRTPTPNSPGVEKVLGVPAEFEVASVKPSRPGDPNHKFQISRGRVEAENIPLKELIAISENMFPLVSIQQVASEQETNFERDMIVGGPKWIESQCFDIAAKAEDASPYTSQWLPDHIRTMLRALLAERFKLKMHTELRPVPVFALTVGKGGPKLTPADPKSRSGCKFSAGEVITGSEIVPMQVQTCQNVTMAQLADSLHAMARVIVDRPAVDMTGLKGGYDLTLQWAGVKAVNALRAQSQAAGGAVPEASDTGAVVTLFEDLEKFGLKIESGRKAPQPVIVIDHVEPLTPDN